MPLNPLAYTEAVVGNFLKYQLSTYAFADARLDEQMRRLLSLEETRRTPLLKGPYISLSQAFRDGAAISDMVAENLLHPHLANLAPYPRVYAHQELAIRSIVDRRTTIVSTGTGSGKTESFLYPIISRALQLRDERTPPGVLAVIVYPMNALAEDQLGRLRELLAGTGVSFAMYVGKTPERRADVTGDRLPGGASAVDYRHALERARREERPTAVYPAEERCSREEIRASGQQPRILLTNVKQLELLLTRQADVELFDGARLEFLVFDEAHTYSGALGGETACLIRRLRAFCSRTPDETVCVATSATLADRERGPEAGREFAERFFGVDRAAVEVVTEQYVSDLWARPGRVSPPLPGNPGERLGELLDVLAFPAAEVGRRIADFLLHTFQIRISPAAWETDLYHQMASSEIVFRIAEALAAGARPVAEIESSVAEHIGRFVPEEEVLCWLLLGAAARRDGRSLLRPVVHAFVRGVAGAVVTFPRDADGPRLWLSAEDEMPADEAVRLHVRTCNTCGQHYFEHFLEDFTFTGAAPEGGSAVGDGAGRVWRAQDEATGGRRVLLVDRVVGAEDDDDDPPRTAQMWLCRTCGALHPDSRGRCAACGLAGALVAIYAVGQDERYPGRLTRCLSCAAAGRISGGQYREPARPVRAVAVADVHVLAQEMVRHAERKRLLVFTDNRQEAAFQAGWMRDHARRFRLRALMWERIRESEVSLGDLGASLERSLDGDDDLSKALLPEVWEQYPKASAPTEHEHERRHFLRIQVLRELATSPRQRLGLEPWGRIRVFYRGLSTDGVFVDELSRRIGVTRDLVVDGLASVLDQLRRTMYVLDRHGRLFSRLWTDGAREIQRAYMPLLRGVPKGLKLRRDEGDDKTRVKQWIGSHETLVRQILRKWNVRADDVEGVAVAFWQHLVHAGLLAPSPLLGPRGNALPRAAGTFQLDADRFVVQAHRGRWRCRKCRRTQVRPAPLDRCLGWRCDGTLLFEDEQEDAYDLNVLDSGATMVRPREHSAQVPADDRERIERAFKSDDEAVNVLVCTPTLELGVDIGTLDTVLMRNVPPLPANYWQRVGRAGRRHRMAVNITYARPASHDRSYFAEPLKMLRGAVDPPRFNLRNELMVRKHLHAAVLTRLQQLRRPAGGLSDSQRQDVDSTLGAVLPHQVRAYLFDEVGNVRRQRFDVSPLNALVAQHESDLLAGVRSVFAQGWPLEDRTIVSDDSLVAGLRGITARLQDVVMVLKRRLDWALGQIQRLEQVRAQKGTLEPDEDALFRRCDRLVKRYKGQGAKARRQAQGYDDINTFNVLSAEGFLPGYGLEIGSVLGTAQVPRYLPDARDFDLPRPPAIALREYVPGNLIYANGQRFVPRFFHLAPQQGTVQVGGSAVEPLLFQVDTSNQAVLEIGAAPAGGFGPGLGAASLKAVPVCDTDLAHQSNISDEEEYRFQLSVAVFGYEQQRHGDGMAYRWGARAVQFRRGVHLRLVNVGPFRRMQASHGLGYPVCLVCGQSRSPFASDTELDQFRNEHRDRCGQPVEPIGFYADVVAHALSIPDCQSADEAYSVAEALRIGASTVLDMDREDLEVLVLRQPGSPVATAVLYDPMPGGSGLLEQICARFPEVVAASLAAARDCASVCERSCIDCLQTFRNAFYHRYLDRHVVIGKIGEWGTTLVEEHPIPAKLPVGDLAPDEMPVNRAETHLRHLLNRAGFSEAEWHKQIDLGRPLGTTSPDCFWSLDDDPGICVYLDGLSNHIHGQVSTRQQDRAIREELRSRGYEVFEIAATQLSDRGAMARHLSRLARLLIGRDRAQEIKQNVSWFEADDGVAE